MAKSTENPSSVGGVTVTRWKGSPVLSAHSPRPKTSTTLKTLCHDDIDITRTGDPNVPVTIQSDRTGNRKTTLDDSVSFGQTVAEGNSYTLLSPTDGSVGIAINNEGNPNPCTGETHTACIEFEPNDTDWTFFNGAFWDTIEEAIQLPPDFFSATFATFTTTLTDLGLPAGATVTDLKVNCLVKTTGSTPPDGHGTFQIGNNTTSDTPYNEDWFVDTVDEYTLTTLDYTAADPAFSTDDSITLYVLHFGSSVSTYWTRTFEICITYE